MADFDVLEKQMADFNKQLEKLKAENERLKAENERLKTQKAVSARNSGFVRFHKSGTGYMIRLLPEELRKNKRTYFYVGTVRFDWFPDETRESICDDLANFLEITFQAGMRYADILNDKGQEIGQLPLIKIDQDEPEEKKGDPPKENYFDVIDEVFSALDLSIEDQAKVVVYYMPDGTTIQSIMGRLYGKSYKVQTMALRNRLNRLLTRQPSRKFNQEKVKEILELMDLDSSIISKKTGKEIKQPVQV